MDAMSTRFQKFGFGSKRKSNIQTAIVATNGTPATTPPPNSSTTSLPQSSMNPQPNGLGRPPSYSNYNAGRPQSPMPPQNQQVAAHHPPPIDTSQRYPGTNPTMGAPQPPGYGGAYGQQPAPVPQPLGQYGPMRPVAEAPGEARNKAQLIVGIDFVSRRCLSTEDDTPSTDMRREPHFLALHSPLQPTPRPKKISSLNGLAQEIRRSKRLAFLALPTQQPLLTNFSPRSQQSSTTINTRKLWGGVLTLLMRWPRLAIRNRVCRRSNGSSFSSCYLETHTSTQ